MPYCGMSWIQKGYSMVRRASFDVGILYEIKKALHHTDQVSFFNSETNRLMR
jgi:hypothetical protein